MEENKFKKIVSVMIITVIFICFLTSLTTTITNGYEVGGSTSGADKYTLLVGLPGMEEGTKTDLGGYLSNLFIILIGVAGVLAVVMIIIGGVMYMTAEASGTKTDAKKKITNAIFGLILALSSYLLLNTIDSDLVKGELSLKPVPAPPATPITPVDETFKGSCKTASGQVFTCSGTTKAKCVSNCTMNCSQTPDIETPCEETGNTPIAWAGICGTPAGKECGGSTLKKCEGNCKTTCTKSIAWFILCQE